MNIQHERVATRCVCCEGGELESSPAVLMPFVAHRVFNWRPVVVDESWGLQTIPKGQAYSVCNSLYCKACDFLFLDIRFSDSEMSNLYRDYRGPDYESLREQYEPGYTLRNQQLKNGGVYAEQVEEFIAPHLKPDPRILDWGGDTGKNSPFRRANKFLHIYDISQKDVVSDALCVSKDETLLYQYDLVVCSEVLEHVPYPSDLLVDIRERMGKDTVLYVEVPYEPLMKLQIESPEAYKRHWHEHINFFSLKALRNLLMACGFSVVESRPASINMDGSVVDVIQCLARKHRLD